MPDTKVIRIHTTLYNKLKLLGKKSINDAIGFLYNNYSATSPILSLQQEYNALIAKYNGEPDCYQTIRIMDLLRVPIMRVARKKIDGETAANAIIRFLEGGKK